MRHPHLYSLIGASLSGGKKQTHFFNATTHSIAGCVFYSCFPPQTVLARTPGKLIERAKAVVIIKIIASRSLRAQSLVVGQTEGVAQWQTWFAVEEYAYTAVHSRTMSDDTSDEQALPLSSSNYVVPIIISPELAQARQERQEGQCTLDGVDIRTRAPVHRKWCSDVKII